MKKRRPDKRKFLPAGKPTTSDFSENRKGSLISDYSGNENADNENADNNTSLKVAVNSSQRSVQIKANREEVFKKICLPEAFVSYLEEVAGPHAGTVLNSIKSGLPEVSIRLNPFKPINVASVAKDASDMNDRVPWCNNGLYLKQRPSFTLDPAFHAGAYYVQEPSSMFLEMLKPLLDKLSPARVLDLCAAPGGKSTHLISMLPLGTQITVNEVIKSRLSILRENIVKWGVPGIKVTGKEAHDGFFDFILVDAPCSGEGMFRKDPAAIQEWSVENVRMCATRQKKIVKDIWNALRPGGVLAYSTCTFNKYENDDNVLWFKSELGAYIISLEEFYEQSGLKTLFNHKIRAEWGIRKSPQGGYQFFPGVVRGEGLYLALLYKPKSSLNSVVLNDYDSEDTDSSKFSLNQNHLSNFNSNEAASNQLHLNNNNSNEAASNQLHLNNNNSNEAASNQLHLNNNNSNEAASYQFNLNNFNPNATTADQFNLNKIKSNKSVVNKPALRKSESNKRSSYKTLSNKSSSSRSASNSPSSKNGNQTLLTVPAHEEALIIDINRLNTTIHQFSLASQSAYNQMHSKSNDFSDKLSGNNAFANGELKSVIEHIRGKWPEFELTKEQAIRFLAREILVLQEAPLGYLKVTYGGLGLGFVKNIGSRANNLLPTNLRIRKL